MTQTERLLQQAKSICTDVTENSEISDELLCSVFERLCLELDMREPTESLQHSHELH